MEQIFSCLVSRRPFKEIILHFGLEGPGQAILLGFRFEGCLVGQFFFSGVEEAWVGRAILPFFVWREPGKAIIIPFALQETW